MTARLFRDSYGVPHLRAESMLALAEAQGRVTAHDRGGQIQVEHWRTGGRLAEHVGDGGVPWDRFARQARLADTARTAYERLDAQDQEWVAAYVAGVNAVLPEARWPDWAPLGILHVAHVLFSDLPALLWREHVHRTLARTHGEEVVDLFQADAGGSGSNAWAVHGALTRTGLPILAGDPHRVLEIPGVYQQVRLACPGVDVVGLAFPGVPGVAHFGHAGSVAWGITNAMAHHIDVFRERLRGTPDGGVEAYGPGGWEPAESGWEQVLVRDTDTAVEVPWVETVRGVVVAELEALPASGDEMPALSARFPARASADLGIAAMRPLLRARSAEDVATAYERWIDPVNRLLVADREGTVLSRTVGRVPDTGGAARRLPREGWGEGADDVSWQPVPPARSVGDRAVDANERPDDPALALGYAYAPPYRAARIRARLADLAGEQVGVDDMAEIHGDTVSLGADALLRHLPDAADEALSPAAQDLVSRLQRWDRQMLADSAEAGAYAAWRAALVRRIAALPVLAPLHEPHGMGAVYAPWMDVRARVGEGLHALLDGRGAAATLGIDTASLVRGALEEVASVRAPSTWGDTHLLDPVRVLDGVPGATFAALERTGLSGDGDTVRATASTPGVSDVCWRGSVARWIWDLSDRDASRWGVPFGAAGDADSPHATDQLATWLAAGSSPVVTAWDALVEEDLL
ncbi:MULTISPECIES: penicillin acylase family protein [Mumia]|uniref:penicillin acylase family protein n=1 Tax=Mumia TaxID=1546255 RepID=UPI001420A0FB|nr:penicillin acylase family protein [Mumia sp. ZJ1417]QMW68083.1 penicillin acylase family protein [Mumia sp. ZJ1417]